MSHDLWIILITMIVTRAWVWFIAQLKAPNSWRCSICTFKAATNNKEVLLKIRQDHMSRHLEIPHE